MTGIYIIENLINGKKYIGQAENIGSRWTTHIRRGSGLENGRTELLYQAMQKYGLSNFSFRILEECNITELDEREAYWIKEYNTYVYNPNSNGYNVLPGGSSNRIISDDAIKYIVKLWDSGLTIGEIHEKVKFCNETITNILKNHAPSYNSEESNLRTIIRPVGQSVRINKYNLKCELVGSYPSINAAAESINTDRTNIQGHLAFKTKTCKGYFLIKSSDDQKESLIKHLNMDSGKHQPVMQFSLDGKLINCYETMKIAADQNDTTEKSIRKSCKGEVKSTKGYHWEYLNSSIFDYISFCAPTEEQEYELIKKIFYTTEDGYAEEKFK